ncbi:MAG: 2,3-bisphosphoglycerate-independent phosphoglycerate mutase [Deltaproteobacteria bacterium]|nr:2,3-bisphosphoglycerate-independent phosphoglycerate mutase [Deltaproteobacteria bacterium]
MLTALEKNPRFKKRNGPLVLMIMDGVGHGRYKEGNGVLNAYTPNLNSLTASCPSTYLKAHGTAVGLPSDGDMGNSEVGHNAMGAGRVFAQGAKLVGDAISSGRMFEGPGWKAVIERCVQRESTLHFIGLFSDGRVHSHIDHLKGMIEQARKEGIKRIRIHTLLDGRDVPETSALLYIDPFEQYLKRFNDQGLDYRIASGGGRMVITMDRYGANWDMVKKGWAVHVHGEGRYFPTAREAIETLRKETGAIDQDLPPFVISDDGTNPVGPVRDDDAVIFFNFRGDRALEITEAFEAEAFDHFDRGRIPDVLYAGMMEYDGDLKVPQKYLVDPPHIQRTVSEYLCASGTTQMAVSETQKFGHVTYFFNGNRTGKFSEELETYVEIPSDIVPFEQRPWMKCAQITDTVCDAVKANRYDFIRLNYPNGDMVGHTGIYQAVLVAMAAMDLCIGRVVKAVEAAGGILLVTADHGNSDEMYEHDKNTGDILRNPDGSPAARTSHSLNPVPFILYDPELKGEYAKALKTGMSISAVAATCLELLGFLPPDDYDPGLLTFPAG